MNKKHTKSEQFEVLVIKILEQLGYEVEHGEMYKNFFFDFKLSKSRDNVYGQALLGEIKYSSGIIFSPTRFKAIVDKLSKIADDNLKVILVINALCDEDYRKFAESKGIEIIDLSNILYLVSSNNELYEKLLGLLEFSVEKIVLNKPKMFLERKVNSKEKRCGNKYNKFLKKLNSFSSSQNQKKSGEYEKLCEKILKVLFLDALSGWRSQQKSNDNLYRFDLICKIKNNVSDEFFGTILKFFNTKYIIFEFKNYSRKITQKEIYTT